MFMSTATKYKWPYNIIIRVGEYDEEAIKKLMTLSEDRLDRVVDTMTHGLLSEADRKVIYARYHDQLPLKKIATTLKYRASSHVSSRERLSIQTLRNIDWTSDLIEQVSKKDLRRRETFDYYTVPIDELNLPAPVRATVDQLGFHSVGRVISTLALGVKFVEQKFGIKRRTYCILRKAVDKFLQKEDALDQ